MDKLKSSTNPPSLKELNRIRGRIKTKLTNMKKYLDEFVITEEEKDIIILTEKLKLLTSLKQEMAELFRQYLQVDEDEEILAKCDEEMTETEQQGEDLEVSLKYLLSKFKKPISVHDTQSEQNSNIESIMRNLEATSKLPDIPLPTFSGNIEQFSIFKQQFMGIISTNKNLSAEQKLFYLKAALRGEAKFIESNEDTFESLFSALEQRFENKRAVVDIHIQDVLKIEKLNIESSKGLRIITDTVNKSLRALKALKLESNDLSNAIVVNIILQKLDKETRKSYELSLNSKEVPNLNELLEFLNSRSLVLDQLNKNTITKFNKEAQNKFIKPNNLLVSNSPNNKSYVKPCFLCNIEHPLYKCSKFLNMSIMKRIETLNEHKVCKNCLKFHNAPCKSTFVCRICKGQGHNTLIHFDFKSKQPSSKSIDMHSSESSSPNSQTLGVNQVFCAPHINNQSKSTLLCTVEMYIENSFNEKIKIKAILDTGSTINILTADVASALRLNKEKINNYISGINGGEYFVKNKTSAKIINEADDFSRTLSFFILPRITKMTPCNQIDISNINFPSEIKLADSTWYLPSKISALLGCETFFELLKAEKIRSYDGSLLLQNSVFGYLITGSIQNSNSYYFSGLISESDNLDISVKQFFELESFPGDQTQSPDDSKTQENEYCEKHFISTHKRDKSGRFIVKLPIIEEKRNTLGYSKEIAQKRLNALWNKLDKNKTMCTLYKAFMEEYLVLNHMERVENDDNQLNNTYYIPHHAVFRPESASTPLRVVFDASAKSSNGVSLNSILLNGGTVQQDLFSIITRFRMHKYAFSSDIKKMYRQILVDKSDTDLQRILWKCSSFAPVETYRLRTVTYGTTSAPFLATRALKALAEYEHINFPQASTVLMTDVYVDDILSGSNDLSEAKCLQVQLIQLLEKGGMQLHKWVSNHPDLFNDSKINEYSFSSEPNTVKTLGMLWQPVSDYLNFKVNAHHQNNFTKREVLGTIAKLFDPLGLIGPVITKAKIFLQGLWSQKLNWNDNISPKDLRDWLRFLQQLPDLNQLKIPRCVITSDTALIIDLHCFCDASAKAFGAVIYVWSQGKDGVVQANLLCSKSRVCPIKALTIPRLELSSAVLLAKLVSRVVSILKITINHIYMWSDSQITLAWLRTPPERLKTFIANRVILINSLCPNFDWRYVPSVDNPADTISRGATAPDLLKNSLWWSGPSFLYADIPSRTDNLSVPEEYFNKELKCSSNPVLLSDFSDNFINDFLHLTNNFTKLCRILSFIYRFIHNSRNPNERKTSSLSVEELRNAANKLVKMVQILEFHDEISCLTHNKNLKHSKVRNLHIFLDDNQILRVGGRLQNTRLSENKKHPKLLPSRHRLTKIIMTSLHKKYLHIGPQTLLHQTRQEYWPIGGRNLARQIVNECIICFKNKPTTSEQLLGNLPPERVNPSPPFSNCGVDFCGPFLIKYKGQRKGTFNKIYVAVFVCFATKAIHLETVTDLTSSALIACLKRFFARRGKSSCIFSDNAKNFVGANVEIKKLHKLMSNPSDLLADYLSNENINWKFIPPRSPNFGGLWESGVKSFKHHLRRAVGSYKLTFEEFLTVTTEIEGILNSRPIVPMSSDPHDYEVLTPGHFLIGRSLNSIPEPNLSEVSDNYLSRWQRTTKLVQMVWKNWSRDYLNHLHLRNKWQFAKDNVGQNDMVILKDTNLPPYKWRLGRIQEIVKGRDGRVRVILIKTSNGIVKRGITQICLLPINND